VNTSYFTIKTAHTGDYEFNTNSPAQAKTWKTEIDKRAEQAKLTHQAILEKEEYQTALASYKDPKGTSSLESYLTIQRHITPNLLKPSHLTKKELFPAKILNDLVNGRVVFLAASNDSQAQARTRKFPQRSLRKKSPQPLLQKHR
jgi:hypothetical protein